MNVIQILKTEHRLILDVLDLLQDSRHIIENGGRVPVAFFDKAGDFCSVFADQFHHFKEEFLLFGFLSHKKQGELDSVMGALRYQHDRCRQCVADIRQALPGYEEKDEMAVTFLLENLAVYVSLLKRHIDLEDRIFLPMAQKTLSSDEKIFLLEQFEAEQRRIDANDDIFEKYRKIRDDLTAMAAGSGQTT